MENIIFEEDSSSGYRQRTIKNASADVTIAIATDFKSGGEILTKNSVLKQNKVYIAIDAHNREITQERIDKLVGKINSAKLDGENKPKITLNIAGNGIYTMKGLLTQEVCDNFTYKLLKAVVEHPDLKYEISLIRSGGQTGFDEAGNKAAIKLGIPTLVYAPKGWKFKTLEGEFSNEKLFKMRFY